MYQFSLYGKQLHYKWKNKTGWSFQKVVIPDHPEPNKVLCSALQHNLPDRSVLPEMKYEGRQRTDKIFSEISFGARMKKKKKKK
jgi:hypothetical protein